VLVDREMIKYIRSLMMTDGLVRRLAAGLDLAPQIRKVCEDFLTGEKKRKLLSQGAALNLLADLSGWLLAGPTWMLHAIDLMERRHTRLLTRSDQDGDPFEGVRIRTSFAATAWFAVAVAVLAAAQRHSLGGSFLGYLLIGFLGVFSLWLVDLLRRLAKRL